MPTILSIEDSVFERKALINMLGDRYEILEADKGEEGIEKYDDAQPDLVLLDLRLPDIDGLDVLDRLMERNAKVIVVSIVREDETIEEAKGLGAIDYITKPVTKEDLVEAVEDAIGE